MNAKSYRATRHCWALAVLLFAHGCGQPSDDAPQRGPEPAPRVQVATPTAIAAGEVQAGSYLVMFRSHQTPPGATYASFASETLAHASFIDEQILSDPRVAQVQFLGSLDLRPRASAAATALPAAGWLPERPRYLQQLLPASVSPDHLLGTLTSIAFSSPSDGAAALQEWDERGDLWFAEPNHISQLAAATPAFVDYANAYRKQGYWWLDQINLPAALTAIANRDQSQPGTPSDDTLLNQRPIVAVFDSGVDFAHPALTGRIWTNSDLNVAGCQGDLHGCNTTTARRGSLGNGDVFPYDTDGPGISCDGRDANCAHGTHVAGIVAGDSSWHDSGGRAAAGICPVCQIMILKIVGKAGKESGILDSSIVAAFKYVSLFRRGGQPAVRVVNASFGKFYRSRAVALIMQSLKERNGTIVVAAAGNEDTLTKEYPAAFGDALSVSAIDLDLRKLEFSNFGAWVNIAAPGANILSTVPAGSLAYKSGTSMAAPLVAGALGLLVARFPGIPYQDLRSALLDGADPSLYQQNTAGGTFNYNYYYPKLSGQKERTPLLGRGILNVLAAVNRTTTPGLVVATPQQPVKPGCSVVGLRTPPRRTAAALAALWLLPLAALVPASLQGRRRFGRRP